MLGCGARNLTAELRKIQVRLLLSLLYQKLTGLYVQRLCDAGHYVKRGTIYRSFERTDISSIYVSSIGQLLLRNFAEASILLQILGENFSNVHLRELTEKRSI